jgi:uncharacterized membrane protein
MTKNEYLNNLKNELAGLDPEVVRDMQSAYELRFIEGASLGKSEDEICQTLEDPKLIAARLKANLHFQQFKAEKSPRSVARLIFSFIGLGMFNLFMLIPTTVFASLLLASFVTSLGLFIGGSAVTAAGFSGVGQVTVSHDRHGKNHHDSKGERKEIHIDGTNITIEEDDKLSTDEKQVVNFFIDKEDRRPSVWKGITMTIFGILLFLMNLVVAKYSAIGVKRYAIMNYEILKNA